MTTGDMDDWRSMQTAPECLKYLYVENRFSDVTFTFMHHGDCTLQAHRVILAMRSQVFEAMLYGPLANTEKQIMLEDDDPETFAMLLGFMYTDEVALNGETVLKCLYTATKYCLDGLVKKCSDFLEQSVTSDNVCTILEQARFYDMTELQEQCFEYIVDNADEIFESTDFLGLSKETLISILASNRLDCNEKSNFNAAIRWSLNQCAINSSDSSPAEVRKYLGEALFQIRFPLIPITDFANEVVPTEILTNDEQRSLRQYHVTNESPTGKVGGRFLSTKRTECRAVVRIHTIDRGTEVINMYGMPLSFPELVIQTRSNTKLQEIRGKFLINVTWIKIHQQPLGEDLLHLKRTENSLNPEEWKFRNGSIVFVPPIILSGQTTMTFGHNKSDSHPSFNIKEYKNKTESRNVEVIVCRVPEGVDAIVVSK